MRLLIVIGIIAVDCMNSIVGVMKMVTDVVVYV